MVTGRRAFQGGTKASTIASILKEEPKPPSQIVEALPRELERIVRRCLRKDRAQRFQDMDDLKVALEELKQESDSGALEPPSSVVEKASPVQGTWLHHHHLPRSGRRSLVLVWSSTSNAVGSLADGRSPDQLSRQRDFSLILT